MLRGHDELRVDSGDLVRSPLLDPARHYVEHIDIGDRIDAHAENFYGGAHFRNPLSAMASSTRCTSRSAMHERCQQPSRWPTLCPT